MRRFLPLLTLLLGVTLLAAEPASAAVAAQAENRASGSGTDPGQRLSTGTRLSAEAIRENAALADNFASDSPVAAKGTIYKVPGSATRSGKPYIGRHNKPEPQKTRRSNDGRDRTQAEVVDEYDPSKPMEGRIKEQGKIDAEGGIENLDNKRNEIRKP